MALAALCGCGKTQLDAQSVREHFEALNGFSAHIRIISDLGQSTLEYEEDYTYNKESSDSFMITAPESLANIGGTIAGEDGTITVQYLDTVLDDAMPQKTGLTPAEAAFGLIEDLRKNAPSTSWAEQAGGETLLVLQYDSGVDEEKTMKQLWLRQSPLTPVYAELYSGDARVLTLSFSQYTEL